MIFFFFFFFFVFFFFFFLFFFFFFFFGFVCYLFVSLGLSPHIFIKIRSRIC